MLSDDYLQSTQSDDHRHHRKEKNRDSARKSRKKHTEKADILHEVRSKLRPLTHSLFPSLNGFVLLCPYLCYLFKS